MHLKRVHEEMESTIHPKLVSRVKTPIEKTKAVKRKKKKGKKYGR